MIFSCNVSELNNALSIVIHAIAVRSTKAVLEGIYVEAKENRLYLVCTDTVIGINTFINAEIEESGSVVVPGRFFCEIIRKLPDESCRIELKDNFQIMIESGSFKTSIFGMDPVEFPDIPEVSGDAILIEQSKLKKMIGATLFAVAVDESRPILTGSLFEINDSLFTIVSLDGYRLALYNNLLDRKVNNINAVLSGKMLGYISKIISDTDEMLEIYINRNNVRISVGNTNIISKLLEGEYIRYRQIIPNEWKTQVRVKKNVIQDAIDRSSLIARGNQNSNLVNFFITDNYIEISSKSENGVMEEKFTVEEMEGKELNIAFNIRYINDVFKIIDDDEILMRFNSNVSPCIIMPTENNNYMYMILPVRVFNG